MKSVPRFQNAVTAISSRYGTDLAQSCAYLRLHLDGHGQLVMQNTGCHRISVTNYVSVAGNYVADPQIVVWMTPDYDELVETESEAEWIPLEMTELFGGWRLAAEVDSESSSPRLMDASLQAEIASYCERILAVSLDSHGWSELSERVDITQLSANLDPNSMQKPVVSSEGTKLEHNLSERRLT